MRLLLIAFVVALSSCGGSSGKKADPHPVNAAFAPAVGTWQATCTSSSGVYSTTLPVGTRGTITVDNRGHLTGMVGASQSIDLWLTTPYPGSATFLASRPWSGGDREDFYLYFTNPDAPLGRIFAQPDAGACQWTLVPIAPG